MSAEISSLLRLMNRKVANESDTENSPIKVTRDFLGVGSYKSDNNKELDLDMEVPSGWEKRLDLKSGRVYIQRCNSPNGSSSSSDTKKKTNQTVPKLQDLNFPPSPANPLLNLLDDHSLDLKLVSKPTSQPSCSYQSVCTLDKVKIALERAEKEPIKKRSSPSCSSSSSSMKDAQEEESDRQLMLPIAAACPSCLLYVLVSKSNPKCPRCNLVVPLPTTKKPRINLGIDLNMSI